jgi:hypothetical protein
MNGQLLEADVRRTAEEQLSVSSALPTSRAITILVVTAGIAHFYLAPSFGLYEDDYAVVSPAFSWEAGDFFRQLVGVFRDWPGGRPLTFFLPPLMGGVGEEIGGLTGIYVLAFAVVACNACLFYALLRRIGLESAAIVGGVAICLFPADTTHSFLTHALELQTSLLFLLVASLAYVSGRRVLAYVIAPLSLITYESPFMIFFAVPLLTRFWNRALVVELARHAAILIGVIVLVLTIRFYLAEDGLAAIATEPWQVARRIGASIVIGPAVTLVSFAFAPAEVVRSGSRELLAVSLLTLPIFAYCVDVVVRSRLIDSRCLLRCVITGLVMLGLAYTVSFTHYPPVDRAGRLTSVHLAAAMGAALLFTCAFAAVLLRVRSSTLRIPVTLVLAAYLSLLTAYRFEIQQDFSRAWSNQRTFWQQVVRLAPDLKDGTLIFVLNHDLPQTRFIQTNSWADPEILAQLFVFPTAWDTPPRLFVVRPDWWELLTPTRDGVVWDVPQATWYGHRETIPDGNVILLEMESGRLVRRFATTVGEPLVRLKSLPVSAGPPIARGALYKYLAGES